MVPLASLWCQLGAFGFPWGDLGFLLVPFGKPLGPFEAQRLLRGVSHHFGTNWTSLPEQMGLKSATCAQKQAARNSSPNPVGSPHSATRPTARNPLHSRRGLG